MTLATAAQLPPGTYYKLIHTFSLILPSHPTDTPDDISGRSESAIARIVQMHPANATEV